MQHTSVVVTHMRKTLLLLILLTSYTFCFAQNITAYTESNSDLAENKLWGISVDQKGNKWIGTSEFGLQKFDGEKFTTFDKNNSIIKGGFISPMFTDSKGNLWISYSKPYGLVKFDGDKWTTFSAKEIKLSRLSIIDIVEDKKGNIYFGGASGITKFNGETWEKITLPMNGVTVRALDVSSDGEIAVGHNSGLLIKIDGEWKSYTDKSSELQLSVVRAVKYIGTKLFIGYGGGGGNGGFSILKKNKWKHYNKSNSNIPDHMVRVIKEDSNGVLWMATNDGVIRFENGKIEPIYLREKINSILDIEIEDDKVWVATFFGLFEIE
jgi:ligand-binding sensor domain-containing protein